MLASNSLKQSRLAWLVLIAGLALSFYAAAKLKGQLEEDAVKHFAFAADQVTLRIDERLRAYALVLRGASGLFYGSEEVTREEWRNYGEILGASESIAAIQGLGVSLLLRPEALDAHTATVRAQGFPDYRVWPEGERELYSAILYLEPFDGRNQRALGYDMFSEPVRQAAMAQAQDTGRAALSGKLALVQEPEVDVQAGTVMYVPIYRKGMPLETIEQRRAALYGWSYSPFRMHDLMRDILSDWETLEQDAVGIRIYDDLPAPQNLLFANYEYGVETHRPFAQRREIDFNGTRWQLAFDHLYSGGVTYLPVWSTLIAGLLLSGLLFALMLSMTNTQRRAERIAEQLTAMIRVREQDLSRMLERFNTVTSRIPGAVYEYRLYPDGRSCFPYASEGMRLVYGITPQEVMDDATPMFNVIHPDDREGVTASLKASAETLTPWREEYRTRLADGRELWVRGEAVPHREDDGSILWYGVITDITVRRESEQALRTINEENQRFREALDHVASFIYMKDPQSRYTYANRITLARFGCTQESLPGSDDTRFFSASTARRLRAIDRRVLHGEHTSEEVETVDADGQSRVYLEIKTPIFAQDNTEQVVGILGISTDITAIKDHQRQLEHVAHYDALTNLPNRVLLADRLQQAMAQALRRKQHLAVVFLDLDGFKVVNDRHGHAAGDELLMNIAARMRAVLREGDTLSRIGGDEFVAVLQDLPDIPSCVPMLTRLLDAAALPVTIEGQDLHVTASLGLTLYPQDEPVEAEQLMRQADQAMYQAKLAGRGRYHVFDAAHDRSVRIHHESQDRLAKALKADEFVLYYQPKVNMRLGKVVGAEALIRWRHPERGLLSPAEFLPMIEDHPLAVEMGDWVIRTALAQVADWQRQGRLIPVSVNIGAMQLRQANFPERLEEMLAAEPEVLPGAFELEVLETSALGDLAQVSSLLERCRNLGVAISLDDFGTGYSSLTYLKRLPAGTVKMDQSFVRDILADPDDLAILEGVLSLAGAFNRQVIAEGVETIAHGDMLLRIGCDLAQGYGIARPMPADELLLWAGRWQPPAHWAQIRHLTREALPLLYAGIAHSVWIDDIVDALKKGLQDRPPLDIHQCRFDLWLQRSGYHNEPGFGPIDMLHRQVHQVAQNLYELQDSGHHEEAMQGVAQLYALRERLLAKLNAYID